MTEPRITYKRIAPGSFPQSYEVYVGDDMLGTVRYKETRYNLRRVFVSREWVARFPDGVTSDGYHTRLAAGQALLEWALKEEPA